MINVKKLLMIKVPPKIFAYNCGRLATLQIGLLHSGCFVITRSRFLRSSQPVMCVTHDAQCCFYNQIFHKHTKLAILPLLPTFIPINLQFPSLFATYDVRYHWR